MKRNLLTLVIVASILSGGLLFLGTTVMGKFSPVLASSLNALVAGSQVEEDSSSIPINESENTVPAQEQPSAQVVQPGITQAPSAVAAGSTPAGTAAETTIAALIKSPFDHENRIVTLSGIVTVLSGEKILLNDGTGQILVELEDNLRRYGPADGQAVTITGRFDLSNSGSTFKLEACSLTDSSGTTIQDDCSPDDGNQHDDGDDDRHDNDDDKHDDDSRHDDDDRHDDDSKHDDDRHDDDSGHD